MSFKLPHLIGFSPFSPSRRGFSFYYGFLSFSMAGNFRVCPEHGPAKVSTRTVADYKPILINPVLQRPVSTQLVD